MIHGEGLPKANPELSGRPLLLLKGHTSKCSSTDLQINPRTTQPAGSQVTLTSEDIKLILKRKVTAKC